MKKIVSFVIVFMLVTFCSLAQAVDLPKDMTKEEKAAAKAKKELNQTTMFKELGLTEEQIKKFKEIQTEANKKSNELKDNSKLTVEEKEAAKKQINDTKNAALKEMLGEEKYKLFNEIKKRQKAEAEAAIKS